MLSKVHVSAQASYESHLDVTTFRNNQGAKDGLHDQGLVAMVLGQSVPYDVQLPFSSRVEEIRMRISLGTEDLDFRCLVAPRNWIALGQIEDRWVQIHATGIDHDELSLERLSDLERILENRF